MRKTAYLLSCLLVILMGTTWGCRDKKPETETEQVDTLAVDTVPRQEVPVDTVPDSPRDSLIAATPMPRAADELFDDFLFNFTANKKLQYERIQFPLTVKEGDATTTIEMKDWKIEKFFMNQEFYTLIFDSESQLDLVKDTTIDHVVVEKIDLRTKRVEQHVFDRKDGLWMLTEVCRNTTYQNPNKSFLDFYAQFAADTLFQKESMDEQVEAILPDPDDDFEMVEGVFSPEQWPDFRPLMMPRDTIYNVLYGQKYAKKNEKLFVIRGIANGLESEMTFKVKDGKWKLVKLVN